MGTPLRTPINHQRTPMSLQCQALIPGGDTGTPPPALTVSPLRTGGWGGGGIVVLHLDEESWKRTRSDSDTVTPCDSTAWGHGALCTVGSPCVTPLYGMASLSPALSPQPLTGGLGVQRVPLGVTHLAGQEDLAPLVLLHVAVGHHYGTQRHRAGGQGGDRDGGRKRSEGRMGTRTGMGVRTGWVTLTPGN